MMNIMIVDCGAGYVGLPKGAERLPADLAASLVEKGNRVCVLYRDAVAGKPLFPLDPRVEQHRIGNGTGRMPYSLRLYREWARLFSPARAKRISAEYRGRVYGEEIARFLDRFGPDVVISCSPTATKHIVMDAGCKAPVVTLFGGNPQRQMAFLPADELAAVVRGTCAEVLLPSGAGARQYAPAFSVIAGGKVVPSETVWQTWEQLLDKVVHEGPKTRRWYEIESRHPSSFSPLPLKTAGQRA